MLCALANLNEEQLQEVKEMEKDLGRPLLAFSCQDLRPAQLDSQSVERIRQAEKELGVALLAVDQETG